ncbi:MAG: Rne/Rng family ribonuclease [Porticoccaceae bacterium]
MGKEILINRVLGETRVAVLDNNLLEQIVIERDGQKGLIGNIYKAKVARVIPGMQAAFLDIGDKRNAILPIDNIHLAKKNTKIESILSSGKTILVQVVKNPVKDKGAVLTTDLSMPSHSLVYLQSRKKLAISRQIKDASERTRLAELFQTVVSSVVAPEGFSGNFILRSVAEGLSKEQLLVDIKYLHRLWSNLSEKRIERGPVLLYEAPPIYERLIKDNINQEQLEITVDCTEIYQDLQTLSQHYASNITVELKEDYQQKDLFDRNNIEHQINEALEKKVVLNCGGTLIIEETEALSVIDVNSASYVGDTEDQETYLKVNLEAADAAARQICLRNLSGIIIIDFIDMADSASERKVIKRLHKAFAKDYTQPTILDFTQLGLVQIARKRSGLSLSKTLCASCIERSAKESIKSEDTVVFEILRQLAKRVFSSSCETIEIYASATVIEKLQKKYSVQIKQYETIAECSVKLYAKPEIHGDKFNIISI